MPSHTTTTSIYTIIYYVVTCAHYYDSGSYYNINCHNELQEIPTLLLFYNPPPRILVIHGLSMKNHVTTEVEWMENEKGNRDEECGGFNKKSQTSFGYTETRF